MALEKQNVPLNLAQIPNQKADPKSLSPGTPTLIKNARYSKANRIDKRYGHSSLTMQDTDGNSITDCKQLIGTQDYLLMWAGNRVYQYVPSLDRWANRAPYFNADVTINSVQEGAKPIEQCDCLYDSPYLYVAFASVGSGTVSDNNIQIYLAVIDQASNTLVSGPTKVGDDITAPKLMLFNGEPYLFYIDTVNTDLYGVRLGTAYTDFIDTPVLMANDVNISVIGDVTSNAYDVMAYGTSRIVVGYRTSTATTSRIRYFNSSLSELTGTYASLDVTSMTNTPLCLRLIRSSGAKFFIVTTTLGAGHFAVIDDTNNIDVAATALTLDGDYNYLYFEGIGEAISGSPGARIFFSVSTVDTVDSESELEIFQITLTESGTEDATLDPFARGVIGWSKPYLYSGQYYMWAYGGPDNNESYFLMTNTNDQGYIVSQIFYGRGLNTTVSRVSINNVEISTGIYQSVCLTAEGLNKTIGVASMIADHTAEEYFNGIQAGKNCYITGGLLKCYDGDQLFEAMFVHPPHTPEISTNTSGGNIAAGTYSVVVIFEWVDRDGYIHRSAPSPAVSITTSGANSIITIEVITLKLTNLNTDFDSARPIRIIPYRTTDGGSIYYRDVYYNESSSTYNDHINDPTQFSKTIVLRKSAADLTINEILYTDSGEVVPSPVPPCRYITSWKNRLWVAGAERDQNVYYSKLFKDNITVEWNDDFSISIQEFAGVTTGIVGFTDKLVLSKRGELFYTYGDGPNDQGAQGDFAPFEKVLGVSGFVSGNSVAVVPEGIWYQSDKGVYLLDQGLNVTYAGAAFEDQTTAGSILKSLVQVTSDTVRFYTTSGILEFDNYFKNWSFQTGITPTEAVIYNRDVYILNNANQVFKENRSVFKDGSTSYGLFVESGWISFAGITGFQRFYRMFLVCNFKSTHSLKVSLAYDYASSYVDEVTFDPTDATDDDTYRFTIFPSVQKCEAFRFKIEEIISDGTAGSHESLQINFVGVLIGTKRGLPKLKEAQKVGVS